MPYHQGLLSQRRQSDDLGGLLDPNSGGGLLGATPQERPLAYYRRTPFMQSIEDQTTGKWLLGMGREPSMPWNNPDPVKAFLGTGSLPAKGLSWLAEAILRPMESGGKQIAGDAPVDPDKITDAALASMGLGYGVTGLVGGVPKGALGANVWHGGPNRWMPEPGYPQGRPLLSRVGTGEGAQAYGHGFYTAEAADVAKTYAPRNLDAEDVMMRRYKAAERAEDYEAMEVWETAMMHDTPGEIKARYSGPDYSPEMQKKAAAIADDLAEIDKSGTIKKLDLPDEDIAKMLDYDAPLSQQPKPVQEAVGRIYDDVYDHGYDMSMRDLMKGKDPTGKEIYRRIGTYEKVDDQGISDILRKAGIPGLKYYDGMSRPRPMDYLEKIKADLMATRKEFEGYFTGEQRKIQLEQMDGQLAQIDADIAIAKKPESARTRNYVVWDQDVLNRTKILAQ